MNKVTLATILGTALLGLSKSKGSLARMNRFHHEFKKNINQLRNKYPSGEAFDITLDIVLSNLKPNLIESFYFPERLTFYIQKTSEYLPQHMGKYLTKKLNEIENNDLPAVIWLDIFAYLAGSPEVKNLDIPVEFKREGQVNQANIMGSRMYHMYYSPDDIGREKPTTIKFVYDSPTGFVNRLKDDKVSEADYNRAMSFFLKPIPLNIFSSIYIDVVKLLDGKSLVTQEIKSRLNALEEVSTDNLKYLILTTDFNEGEIAYHVSQKNYSMEVRDIIMENADMGITPLKRLESDLEAGNSLDSYKKEMRRKWFSLFKEGKLNIVGEKSFFEQIINKKLSEFESTIKDLGNYSTGYEFSLDDYADITNLYNRHKDKIKYMGDLNIDHSIPGDDVQIFLVQYLDDRVLSDLADPKCTGGDRTCLSAHNTSVSSHFGVLLRIKDKIYAALHLYFNDRRFPLRYNTFQYCQNATSNKGTLGKRFGFQPFLACEEALQMLPIDWTRSRRFRS